jgi:LysR family transcriptional regulator, transcription activator of glutamate synthase operon
MRDSYGEMTAVDSDQLRAFVVLARDKRFTVAAKRLGTSQPTLSRRVQQLERELGARLVVRGPGGVVLTGAGTRFLPQAEHAIASIDAGVAALGELASEPTGLVAIGAQHTIGAYVLPAVLAAFHEEHPAVRLRIVDALPPELEERLARGDIDLALLNLPVRRLDLTTQKLWQEDYVLAVPPQHRLASSRRPIALTEAADEPLVVIPNVPATAALEAACAERGVEPKIVVEVGNLETARRMVERGLGVALLPRIVAQSHAQSERKGRFVPVEIGRGGFKRQVALLHRGEAYLSAAARALRTTLVEKLAVRK